MLRVEEHPDRVLVETTAYRFELQRTGDRWSHRLFALHDALPVLESVEGGPDDATPPSPAFQDLRIERPAENVCEAQLFGQCGRLVYSGVIRCTEGEIHFDQSARSRTAPTPAMSTYLSGMTVEAVGAGELHVGSWPIHVSGDDPSPSVAVVVDASRLRIEPASKRDRRTVQWAYTLGPQTL